MLVCLFGGRAAAMAGLLVLAGVGGTQVASAEALEAQEQPLPAQFEPLFQDEGFQDHAVIAAWNELAVDTAHEVDEFLRSEAAQAAGMEAF